MQGAARDYLRQNLDDYTLWEYVNNDTLYFNGGKDRDKLQPLRGRLQPRRLYHQGQAVVLRLHQPDLRPDGGPEGLQLSGRARSRPSRPRITTYNGSIKLSAAPFAGLRVAASYINNFSKYRGALPSIQGYDNRGLCIREMRDTTIPTGPLR